MKKATIVILHGWGLDGKIFSALSAILRAAGHTVYAPDFPGFGESSIPDHPLMLVDYADFLHRYLGTHHIEKPIFIGHSFGGRVLLKYQEKYHGKALGYILTGVPGYTPVPKKKLMFFIYLAKVGKFMFSLPVLSTFQENVRRWYYYFVGAKEYYRAQGEMRQTFKNIVQEDLVAGMKAVDVPCLLVWGKEDLIVPIRIAHRMLSTISGSQLVLIDNADHGVPFKQPDKFYDAIRHFIHHASERRHA